MSRQKAKGTAFESQCVGYLRQKLGDDDIERCVLHGSKDEGDIRGVKAHGYKGVIECKNYAKVHPTDLKKWKHQTIAERDNADADFALLVVHKPGCGEARFGENDCHLQVRDLDKVQGYTTFVRDPSDPLMDAWVRMDLEMVCDLMVRGEGSR